MSPTLLEFAVALLLIWIAWQLGMLLFSRLWKSYHRSKLPKTQALLTDKNPPNGQP